MTGVDHPTIPYSAPPPPSGDRPGRNVWIAVGVAAVALLIGGGALLGYVLLGSDSEPTLTADPTETETESTSEAAKTKLEGRTTDQDATAAPATAAPATAPPATAATATAPPATAAPATAPPATAPPPAPRAAVPARVSRTCGADGTGDCFVTFRPAPSSKGANLGQLDEGDTVTLECQQRGESVRASALGYSTDVWARSTDGRWLAMAFLDAPGWSLSDVTVPC